MVSDKRSDVIFVESQILILLCFISDSSKIQEIAHIFTNGIADARKGSGRNNFPRSETGDKRGQAKNGPVFIL